MKYLTFLFLTIFSFSGFCNFMPKNRIGDCNANKKVFLSKKKCGADCEKLPRKYNCEFHKYGQYQVDDLEKPIYSKTQAQTCTATSDCETLNATYESTSVCESDEQVIMRLDTDPKEVYCSKITGYQQKTVTGVYEDASLKATYTASVQQKQAIEAGLQQVAMQRACGQRVLDFISVLNAQKNITVEQTRTMLSLFDNIRTELKEGALETAKDSLQSVDTSQIILDASDIDKIIAELDKCMQ